MNRAIKKIVKDLDIDIKYSMNMDCDGYFIAKYNCIVINTQLSDYEQEQTILHELGHACLHKNEPVLYQATQSMRLKMEAEANEFMAKKLMDSYLSNPELDVDTFNPIKFLEWTHLDSSMEPKIKKWYADYCVKSVKLVTR